MATAIDLIKSAKSASLSIGLASTDQKNRLLAQIADLLPARSSEIIAANAMDLDRAVKDGLSLGIQDRLRLDEGRIQALAEAVRKVIEIPDPIGGVIREIERPNGLKLTEVRVPFGVVGAIYEARPNVTIDIASLALKAGNAIVLRGGTAAENTNRVLVTLLQDALSMVGLDGAAVQTVDEFGREGANAMMTARGLIDVLIPRGGSGLINSVVEQSKVPVIQTGDGVVHVFIDETAREDWAIDIVVNSKTQRYSVCNTLETLLVHESHRDTLLPKILDELTARNVKIHADQEVHSMYANSILATEQDWSAEYLSLDLAVKLVPNLDAALRHIAKYSTQHTEAIVTESEENAARFLSEVDAAVVTLNASTRFTDGGEFGFGAEVGISTQKLHARGPMGLAEITSSKWLVIGSGQTRV